jgi:uncharacterized protein YigA (DUF484 family)
MEFQIHSLQEQLLAAQDERDSCARKVNDLQRDLSVCGAALKLAETEVQRQAFQLAEQIATSEIERAAAASMRSRLEADLQASQKHLSESKDALRSTRLELEHEKEVAASSLAAAVLESQGLLQQVQTLQNCIAELEKKKLLLETSADNRSIAHEPHHHTRQLNQSIEAGHSIGSIYVGVPEHHHGRKCLPHSTAVSESPAQMSHSSDSCPNALDHPLTSSIAALVSSANLPPRQSRLSRSKSGSNIGSESSVLQVRDRSVFIAVVSLV